MLYTHTRLATHGRPCVWWSPINAHCQPCAL